LPNYLSLFTPFALTLSTALVFYFAGRFLGKKAGYLVGFIFYWVCWCLLFPLVMMDQDEVLALVKPAWPIKGGRAWPDLIYLLIPLIFAFGYAFPKALKKATPGIMLTSFLLSVVNASLEEFLWRGLYYEWLKSLPVLYVLISSFGFSAWHLSPQILFPNKAPGGRLSFLAFAFVLGILFSLVVIHTGSIFAVIICHILFDFSGLGARIYFSKDPV